MSRTWGYSPPLSASCLRLQISRMHLMSRHLQVALASRIYAVYAPHCFIYPSTSGLCLIKIYFGPPDAHRHCLHHSTDVVLLLLIPSLPLSTLRHEPSGRLKSPSLLSPEPWKPQAIVKDASHLQAVPRANADLPQTLNHNLRVFRISHSSHNFNIPSPWH